MAGCLILGNAYRRHIQVATDDLDDLHWADDASLSLLQHLAQHTRASRVFVLGAYRDTDLPHRHPLRRMIHDLSRERLADRLAVTRLSQAGTAAG